MAYGYRPAVPRIAMTMALLLLLAACSSPQSGDENVRPFEEIAVAGPVVEVDPSGTFATVTVTTSIDAVCAVSYGPDEDLGSIATDQNMDPNGHSDHNAVMKGLVPGTEYQYRLQGIGPDGTLYRSDILTFSTPEATESALPGPNIALNATVADVSSEFSDAFAAENAIDGDISTEWSSQGDGDDAYITLDLGRPVEVVGVGFRTRSMSDGTATTNSFTVTVDGSEPLGPFPAAEGLSISNISFIGQTVRIDVDESTGGNTGAIEIEVYEAP